MKYVIFKKKLLDDNAITYHPVIFAEHTTHSQIKYHEPRCIVHSAGFCHLIGKTIQIEDRGSESLGIGPSQLDTELLNSMIFGMGSYAFLKFEDNGKEK